MSIKQWPRSERPIERLHEAGVEHLSDAELLAILLATGCSRRGLCAVACARSLLEAHVNLRTLACASSRELLRFPGIGPVKAARLLAAFEIGRRLAAQKLSKGSRYGRSEDVFQAFGSTLRDEKKESFYVLLLDSKNRCMRADRVSTGSLDCSIVHPREVFLPAIRNGAAAVLFVHNHPSGDPSPSEEDKALTQRLVEAGRLIGIRVLDHIIIGDGAYYSFHDQGRLQSEASR